ncbi:hypothetical protein ABIF68_006137 [Bradyrhizobium japonicum]
MPNDSTTRGYPLPHPDNVARDDAQRIRDAITAISEDLEGMGIEPASETEIGGVRLATAAEATAGTTQAAVPVVKRVMDMIASATTALHTTIVGQYGAAITTAINDLKGGVDPAYDTLVEIAAKLTDMTQINAILSSLANRLRIDTAAQGLDATAQSNGRANLGLAAAALKAIATAANLKANTGADVVTTDQAWSAAAVVNLGNVSGTVTIDLSQGVNFKFVTVGNVTLVFANAKSGQAGMVSWNNGGAFTVSLGGSIYPIGGLVPLFNTANGAWNALSYAVGFDAGVAIAVSGGKLT